jgi:arylsulfatase A-like enzyme
MTKANRGAEGGPANLTRLNRAVDAALLGIAGAYALVFSEWLFFVTKPSLFTPMGWGQRVTILAAAGLPVALVAATSSGLLAALLPGRRSTGPGPAGALAPAFLLTLTVFLLVENFSKTALGWNVGSFTGPARYLYALGLLLLLVALVRRLQSVSLGRTETVALVALLGLSLAASALRYQPLRESPLVTRDASARRVNVLLFSSDGIEARRMSVYGAERKTTPFLESRIDEFLVSENHFTNAATTAGSNGALLTGKLPITTGLTQAGDAFRGVHVYQHLPGVLRQLGYHNIEIGLRHNADAYDHNLRRGFHVANGRTLMVAPLPLAGWFADSFPSEQYFLGLTQERLRERVEHAFNISDMQDTFAIVTGRWRRIPDEQRMAQLRGELERAPRPFFAQVHLMGTHGERFDPRQRTFSAGREQRGKWDLDFHDDTILDFDGHIAEIMGFLEERGELDDTLLIINSDHGLEWATAERLPLLFRFPGGEPRGTLPQNTQRIDIAPTILDYLEVEPPGWMEGASLLRGQPDRLRPIVSTGFLRKGPFLPWLSLVQCQSWSELDLDSGRLDERTIAGHTDPCAPRELPTSEESRQYLLERLSGAEGLPEPLLLGERLERLRTEHDPDDRREVAEAIIAGTTVRGLARRLDHEIAVARVHYDFWTRGTSSAGIVVHNPTEHGLARRIVVESGRERDFPVRFHVEDGEQTHTHVFERPGAQEIELAPVEPGAARLFILWSDSAFASGKRRALGVKLSLSLGERLGRLRESTSPEAWHDLAGEILRREVPARELSRGLFAANLHFDSWTRGAQPGALLVRNRREQPWAPRLVIDSGPRDDLPASVLLADGREVREHEFETAGRVVLDLGPVPPRSEALFLVWTDKPWTPGEPDPRWLGIRLSAE